MTGALTYAVVGGPPVNWHDLQVLDRDTGAPIDGVVEVNTVEGWLIRYIRDEQGRLVSGAGKAAKERVVGNFMIVERPQ